MITGENLCLSFGARQILDHASISILKGDRVALVGQNGAGKSTLLKILAKEISPDLGKINLNSKIRVGHLRQEPDLLDSDTVEQAIRKGMSTLFNAIKLHAELCEDFDKNLDQISNLGEQIEYLGGFDAEHRIEQISSRLHLVKKDQLIKNLSGGEKRRVDLARIMLGAPDIYLLDEPTNHLDIDSIDFLVKTFKTHPNPIIFISHDKRFVNELATRIIEVESAKLFKHEPPYQNYLENKVIRMDIAERSLHRREQMAIRELAWLRAGVKARTTKQNARISRADELISGVQQDISNKTSDKINLQQADTKRLAKKILEFKNISFSYGDRELFKNINLILKSGDRYGILGPNGAGKSTLMSLIADTKKPTSGEIIRGLHTETVLFEQNRRELDPEKSLQETLSPDGDYVFLGEHKIHIASYLERFLFEGLDKNRKVETLSGGEQNRLLLAKLFTKNANCLLLDEPTNDLDMATLGVLEETLTNHRGVAFVISHDRDFLDRICTGIIAFEEHGVEIYEGNYTNYINLKTKKSSTPKLDKSKTKLVPKAEKQKIKRSYKEEREYEQIESQIQNFEQEKQKLEQELSNPEIYKSSPEKAGELTKELESITNQIQNLYARWEELESIS